MIVAINDLPFEETFSNKEEAIEKVRQWMDVCKKMESEETTKVDGLIAIPLDSYYSKDIAPGYKLMQLIKEFQTQDDRRYLLHLLTNLDTACEFSEEPFCFGDKESYICAYAKNGFVISLEISSQYGEKELNGRQGREPVIVKNIANRKHINIYKNLLGIRCYEANKKHRKEPYIDAAGRYVDAMDLNDEEAQKLLNQAVEINGNLYAKKNGQYYCFQNHHDNCYHGYQNNELGLHITKKLDAGRWE